MQVEAKGRLPASIVGLQNPDNQAIWTSLSFRRLGLLCSKLTRLLQKCPR